MAEAGRFEVQFGELLRAAPPLFQVLVAGGEAQEARHVGRGVGREEHPTASRLEERELAGTVAGGVDGPYATCEGEDLPVGHLVLHPRRG